MSRVLYGADVDGVAVHVPSGLNGPGDEYAVAVPDAKNSSCV
jgi:hypothetical protein